ncbi:MAG TPA: glycoside hydrolase family 5 protein [Polyangiaceae bacterium]|nr:glycoside hydrolase family 5 protein [Polyangiaceae bacterium]
MGGVNTQTPGGTSPDGSTAMTPGATPAPPPVNVGGAPADLNCGSFTIAAADVISDFSTPTPTMYASTGPSGERGGTSWLSYAATPASDPISAGNAFAIDPAQSGPCNSGGSLHVSSPGNTGYGVGFGINFKPDTAAGNRDLYDAAADGVTGVGFFAQCKQEIESVFMKFSDDATEFEVDVPQCSFDGAAPLTRLCRQYGIKNAVLMSNGWTHYEIYFADTLLDTDATVAGTGLHTNALTAFQIQVNSKADSQPNGFDCLIDDVHFLRTPAPATPPPGNVTTVAGHTIAPGGFYTEGNRIFDAAGNVHVFKGLARPSMEFDPAGQGITRDDVRRMWATGANVIRYSLSEGYWLSTHPQFNANYQSYVDRAVQWTLQNDMAVILDLHWSGNPAAQQIMADRQALTFWQQVANKYKGDGRVIFELYNEPHDLPSNTVWRNGDGQYAGMQQMYDIIRATGANNLVLAGGLDYANDLDSLLPAQQLTGINIAYVTHPYRWKNPPSGYDASVSNFPIFATEFGDAEAGGIGPQDCGTAAYSNAIADFTRLGVSWTSWAWTVAPNRCAFPALLDKYDGTPTPPGAVVFAALKN